MDASKAQTTFEVGEIVEKAKGRAKFWGIIRSKYEITPGEVRFDVMAIQPEFRYTVHIMEAPQMQHMYPTSHMVQWAKECGIDILGVEVKGDVVSITSPVGHPVNVRVRPPSAHSMLTSWSEALESTDSMPEPMPSETFPITLEFADVPWKLSGSNPILSITKRYSLDHQFFYQYADAVKDNSFARVAMCRDLVAKVGYDSAMHITDLLNEIFEWKFPDGGHS